MSEFFEHFTQRKGSVQYNNSVNFVCTTQVVEFAGQVIGEKVPLSKRNGMEWRVFQMVPIKLECYLIWMRGHYQYTTMKESWV